MHFAWSAHGSGKPETAIYMSPTVSTWWSNKREGILLRTHLSRSLVVFKITRKPYGVMQGCGVIFSKTTNLTFHFLLVSCKTPSNYSIPNVTSSSGIYYDSSVKNEISVGQSSWPCRRWGWFWGQWVDRAVCTYRSVTGRSSSLPPCPSSPHRNHCRYSWRKMIRMILLDILTQNYNCEIWRAHKGIGSDQSHFPKLGEFFVMMHFSADTWPFNQSNFFLNEYCRIYRFLGTCRIVDWENCKKKITVLLYVLC